MQESTQQFGRLLLVLGGALVVLGAFLCIGGKLPFRLGRLPGDIYHRGQHGSFYFPIVTCLLVSILLSVLAWLVQHFRR